MRFAVVYQQIPISRQICMSNMQWEGKEMIMVDGKRGFLKMKGTGIGCIGDQRISPGTGYERLGAMR